MKVEEQELFEKGLNTMMLQSQGETTESAVEGYFYAWSQMPLETIECEKYLLKAWDLLKAHNKNSMWSLIGFLGRIGKINSNWDKLVPDPTNSPELLSLIVTKGEFEASRRALTILRDNLSDEQMKKRYCWAISEMAGNRLLPEKYLLELRSILSDARFDEGMFYHQRGDFRFLLDNREEFMLLEGHGGFFLSHPAIKDAASSNLGLEALKVEDYVKLLEQQINIRWTPAAGDENLPANEQAVKNHFDSSVFNEDKEFWGTFKNVFDGTFGELLAMREQLV